MAFRACRGATRLLSIAAPKPASVRSVTFRYGFQQLSLARTQLPTSPNTAYPASKWTLGLRSLATKSPKSAKPKTTKAKGGKKSTQKSTKKKPAKKATRKTKKTLTEAQQTAAKDRKQRDDIRKLKKTALAPPKQLPTSSWAVLNQEIARNEHKLSSKEASERYKTLSSPERDQYQRTADQNKTKNQSEYRKWVESHTPDEIRLANNARLLLKRRVTSRSFPPIKDNRQVKRPTSAYLQFSLERSQDSDMSSLPLGERSKSIGEEWKSLNAGEKQKYVDLYEADKKRYNTEYRTVFNRAPASKMPKAARAA